MRVRREGWQILQEWQTVMGDASVPSFPQPEEVRLDLTGVSELRVRFDSTKAENCTVALEVAKKRDSVSWRQTIDLTTSGDGTYTLRRETGTTSNFLDNFLRWNVERSSAAAWYTTFRIMISPVK
jgi:hypothetical protein